MGWSGDTSSGSATVNNGSANLKALYDCGPGYQITAYEVDLTLKFYVSGSSLSSCSIGLPANVSCTGSSSLDVFTLQQTCKTYVYSCLLDVGPINFYPGPGGKFSDTSAQAAVTLRRSDGQTFTQ